MVVLPVKVFVALDIARMPRPDLTSVPLFWIVAVMARSDAPEPRAILKVTVPWLAFTVPVKKSCAPPLVVMPTPLITTFPEVASVPPPLLSNVMGRPLIQYWPPVALICAVAPLLIAREAVDRE